MPAKRFARFVAVDWSGQNVARPKGLAVAIAEAGSAPPRLLRPEDGWSRGALLDWFGRFADERADTLIGLDLSPALPFEDAGGYFPGWAKSPKHAKSLWAMVDEACEADPHLSANGFLADPAIRRHFRLHREPGDLFSAGRGRLRICERRQLAAGLSPSSTFNLVGAAQVGKSSLTGMRVLHRLGGRIPVWPFDRVPPHGPVIVEIYTTIAARAAGLRRGRSKVRDAAALDAALTALASDPAEPLACYDDHSTDALITAAWLRGVAAESRLWSPEALTPEIAHTEGWTFGVG